MQIDIEIKTKIYLGENQYPRLKQEIQNKNTLIISGKTIQKQKEKYQEIKKQLENAKYTIIENIDQIQSINQLNKIKDQLKETQVIIAIGGSSLIDKAKILALGINKKQSLKELIQEENQEAIPLITIPTRPGTGTEVSEFAVIKDQEEQKLQIIQTQNPIMTILDPTLTYSLDEKQTAISTINTLTNILESYLDMQGPLQMLERIMEGQIKALIENSNQAMLNPQNYKARANLMLISAWAMNGLIRSNQENGWSLHPMEQQLKENYEIQYGQGLADIIPNYLRYTLNNQTILKYYNLGINVFNLDKNQDIYQIANQTIDKIQNFIQEDLQMKDTLKNLKITQEEIKQMSKNACQNGIIMGFIPLKQTDIQTIYTKSI